MGRWEEIIFFSTDSGVLSIWICTFRETVLNMELQASLLFLNRWDPGDILGVRPHRAELYNLVYNLDS